MSSTYLPSPNQYYSRTSQFIYRFFPSNQNLFPIFAKIIGAAFIFLVGYGLRHTIPNLRDKFFPTTPPTSKRIPFRDYPVVGKAAIQFAREQIKVHADVVAQPFDKDYQPINSEITKLKTLYWTVYWKNLQETFAKHASQEKPWEQPEVENAVEACMKIAYTIGCLTLEDLKPFTDQIPKESAEWWTNQRALVRQDSYQYRTFYYCPRLYHMVRGAYAWAQNPHRDNNDLKTNPFGFYNRSEVLPKDKQSIDQQYAQFFYTQTKVQNTWNELYNDYCDRIRMYVAEDDLREEDSRHVNWTRKDTELVHFIAWPGNLPTGV